jgi:acyl-CoA thioester hydrolase
VVLHHELDYFAPARAGDVLDVVTWVPSCTPLTCHRFSEIVKQEGGALLARGASSYCMVDAATGKPRRLSEALRRALGSPELVKRVRVERAFPARPGAVRPAPGIGSRDQPS